MLDDLQKGNACIKIIDQVGDPALANFANANQLFTVKDTFQVLQAQGTVNPIKISQGDKTIFTDVESGDFTIVGDIPTSDTNVFDKFYTTNSGAAAVDTDFKIFNNETADYSGKGYSVSQKTTPLTVAIVSASRSHALVLMNVQFVVNYANDDEGNVQRIQFIGTVLGNTVEGKEDFYVIKKKVTAG